GRARTGRRHTSSWTASSMKTSGGARRRGRRSRRRWRRRFGCWAGLEGAGWSEAKRRLLDKGQLSCLDDRLELRVHPQLAPEAADVGANRRVADPELGRDVAAGGALGHQPQHLLLARGEALELAVHRPASIEKGRD